MNAYATPWTGATGWAKLASQPPIASRPTGPASFARNVDHHLAPSRTPSPNLRAAIPTEGPADGREPNPREANPVNVPAAHDPEDRLAARARVEAVLLIAKTPLNYRRLAALADVEDATSARTLVAELNQLYDRMGRGIRIEQIAGGQRLMTRAVLAPWLRRLGFLAPAVRLSWPMMETLAVVAYRQDVTRADVESVRGVACGEILRQLMHMDLVRISGRSEDLGRPYLYGTTKRFLKICGLASINSLPPIDWHADCDDVSQSTDGVLENNTDESPPRHPSEPKSHPRNESSRPDDSQVTKESDVSIALTETLATEPITAFAPGPFGGTAVLDANAPAVDPSLAPVPAAAIEDEEDDLYEKGFDTDDDEEDDDFDDDDWDDDEEDDEDEDDDDEDDSDDDDDDEEEDDVDTDSDWEEVDDDEADEDWDDEEDDLDEEEDDDENWEA